MAAEHDRVLAVVVGVDAVAAAVAAVAAAAVVVLEEEGVVAVGEAGDGGADGAARGVVGAGVDAVPPLEVVMSRGPGVGAYDAAADEAAEAAGFAAPAALAVPEDSTSSTSWATPDQNRRGPSCPAPSRCSGRGRP